MQMESPSTATERPVYETMREHTIHLYHCHTVTRPPVRECTVCSLSIAGNRHLQTGDYGGIMTSMGERTHALQWPADYYANYPIPD